MNLISHPTWILSLALVLGAGCDGGSSADDDDAADDDTWQGDDDASDDDASDDDASDDDASDDDASDDDASDDDASDDDASDDDASDDDATAATDADGDGYDQDEDCDDTDPAIHPGATEVRDAADQDCDGLADEGLILAGDLLITEIMQNPLAVSDTDGEWFEVLNTSGSDILLDGWTVRDADGGEEFTVPPGTGALGSGDYAVLGRNGDPAANGGTPVDVVMTGIQLGNGDDELVLDLGGLVVDEVAWASGAGFPNPNGASMQLAPDLHDAAANDEGSAWCLATEPYGDGDFGTPGAPNDACATVVDADGDGFSPPEDCDDADPGVNPAAVEIPGNAVDEDCDGVVDPGDPGIGAGELVITEIMPNPAAVNDSEGEWFEVYNTTGHSIDLEGLEISDAAGSVLVGVPLSVPSHGYAVLARNADALVNGGVVSAFGWGSGISLNNGADSLVLTSGGTVVDRVDYDTAAGWTVEEGKAMQTDRGVLSGSANDNASAWCSATETYGDGDSGTPGAVNSDCEASPSLGTIGPGDLVITEIMKNPAVVEDSVGEWFELYNTSAETLDLQGIVATEVGTDTFTVGVSILVPSHGYVVLCRNADPDVNGGIAAPFGWGSTFSLGNDVDEIVLTFEGAEIDSVVYDDGGAFPDPNGASMQLDPAARTATLNDLGENWCEATAPYGGGDNLGTPGLPNAACP